jgi:hypothetical protein
MSARLETRLRVLEAEHPAPRRIRVVWPLGDPACPSDVQNVDPEPGGVAVRVVYEDTKGT